MGKHERDFNCKASKRDEHCAQLTLTALKSEVVDACPDDEKLAAMADHRLDDKARKKIIAHLNGCDECYQAWLNATTRVAEKDDTKKPARPKKNHYGYAMAAMAAAACLIFFMILYPISRETDTATLVAEAYESLLSSGSPITSEIAEQASRFPKRRTGRMRVFAFGSRSAPSAPQRSFGAGLWFGADRLVHRPKSIKMPELLSPASYTKNGQGGWTETSYAPYFQLGQWCVAVKAASLMENQTPLTDFWQVAGNTATRLKHILETKHKDDEYTNMVVRRLEAVSDAIDKNKANGLATRERRDISDNVNRIIDILAPAIR